MHDPKTDNEVQRFEKEVQQKMGELEFSPSAAVWANVERAVKKEKRRRVPVFWLFFLPALLLIGAAGIYYIGGHSGTTHMAKNDPAAPSVIAPSSTPGSGSVPTISSEQPASTTPASVSDQPTANPSIPNPSVASRPATTSSNTIPSTTNPVSHTTPPPVTPSAAVADHTTQLAATRPATHNNSSQSPASPPHRPTALSAAAPTKEEGQPDLLDVSASRPHRSSDPDKSSALPRSSDPAITSGLRDMAGDEAPIQPAKIDFHRVSGNNAPKVSAAPLTTAAAKAMVPKTRLSPKRPWEAGFTGGIGVSSLHEALFKQSPSSLNDSRNFAAPAPVTGPVSGGSAAQNYTSKIQSDLAFWAGIFVQKALLKNLSVSVGLNLHYYSTKVYTGDKITSTNAASYNYSQSSYLLSAAAASGPGQTYPYYTPGDKQVFINRYYFLEIPGSVQWQISHSRVMPLFWEGGFSLSYLMSSNALYYNTHAGVFYKDGDVTNKTQFNLSTALLVGIPFKGVNLQVGPQVQYGLTSLLNTGQGGQHFFYGGIKLVVFPGKAHKGGKHRFRLQEQ
ncbi:MAG TPA: hypothetical protein VL832_08155 [Puia sp.]|nr:hypothetical protein [Puia sp.]